MEQADILQRSRQIILVLLLASSSWGQSQTVTSHTESDVQDTSAHIRVVLSAAVTSADPAYLRYHTATFSDCSTGTVWKTIWDPIGGNPDTDHPEFVLSGLTKNTQYFYGVCVGTTMLSGVNPPYTFTTTNSSVIHPAYPTAPAATTWTGATPTTWTSTRSTDGTCSDFLTQLTNAANQGAGNHQVIVPSGQTCSPVTTPTHAAGTVYVMPSNIARLPPDQARVNLALDAQHMYRIRPTSNHCVNQTTQGWVFIGLDCRPSSTTTVHSGHIMNAASSKFFCDRCILTSHLQPGATQGRAFNLGSGTSNLGVVNSYVHYSDNGTFEAGGIIGDSANTVLIQNNKLHGSGVAAVFAADGDGTNGNQNWLVKKNLFLADERQRKGSATNTPAGAYYTMRQPLEFKRCIQCAVKGNIFDNWWADVIVGQASGVIVLSPRMINPAARALSDIEVAYNFITRSAGFLVADGLDDSSGREPLPSMRLDVHNNVMAHMDANFWPDGGNGCTPGTASCDEGRVPLLRTGSWTDLKFHHNTQYELSPGSFGGRMIDILSGPCGDCKFDDNIVIYRDNASFGGCRNSAAQWIDGTVPTDCKDKLTEMWPRHSFKGNVIRVKSPSTTAAVSSALPSGNSFPGDDAAGLTATGFANGSAASTAARDFRLNESTSAYRGAAQDGRAPGANWIKVQEEIGGVQNFSVQQINTTSIVVGFSAYGGLTAPGTACFVDANTSSTFTNAPVRVAAAVNAAIPAYQTGTITGLTSGTTYYIRVHCGGEPFIHGGASAPIAVRTR